MGLAVGLTVDLTVTELVPHTVAVTLGEPERVIVTELVMLPDRVTDTVPETETSALVRD